MPGRSVHLVAGEGVEVAADGAHVDAQVRRGLRAVEQHRHAGGVRVRDELCDRIDRAERVRDVRERDEARARAEQALERRRASSSPASLIGVTLSVRAGLLAHELPRHDVRVVLHPGDEDLVAGLSRGRA